MRTGARTFGHFAAFENHFLQAEMGSTGEGNAICHQLVEKFGAGLVQGLVDDKNDREV